MSSLTHPSRTPFLSWMTVGVILTFVLVGTLNIPHRVHHIGADTRQLAGTPHKELHDDGTTHAHHQHGAQAPSSDHHSHHEDEPSQAPPNTNSSSCVLASFVLNNHLLQTDPLSLATRTNSCILLKRPVKKFHKSSIEGTPPSRAPPRSTAVSIFS